MPTTRRDANLQTLITLRKITYRLTSFLDSLLTTTSLNPEWNSYYLTCPFIPFGQFEVRDYAFSTPIMANGFSS